MRLRSAANSKGVDEAPFLWSALELALGTSEGLRDLVLPSIEELETKAGRATKEEPLTASSLCPGNTLLHFGNQTELGKGRKLTELCP